MRTAGDIIRDQRKKLGHTLEYLADKMKCSDSHLSDIEHNRRIPTSPMIVRLAKHLVLDGDYLHLIFGRVPATIRRRLLRQDFSVFTEMELRLSKAT